MRLHDTKFDVVASFPGTTAAGFGNGEGLAAIGNILYVQATRAGFLVSFELTAAVVAPPAAPTQIPSLTTWGLIVLSL